MISPETNLNSLKGIPNRQSHNIPLLLIGITIPIGNLLLNTLNNANYIYHLTLHPLVLMLPTVVLELVLSPHVLILDLVDFVLFVLESNLRSAFHLLPVEQLHPLDVVDPASTQLLRFFKSRTTSQVDAHQIALTVYETQVEERHRTLLRLFTTEFYADQPSNEVPLLTR